MPTVRDLLKFKGDRRLVTIGPDETVLDGIRLMSEHDIGCLIVLEDDAIRGIISERDYARKIVLEGRSSSETSIREIMRSKVKCVGLGASIDECRAVMTEDNIRYVPVVADEFLVGLVSISDVIRHAISEKEFLISQLTCYITGTHTVTLRGPSEDPPA